MTSMLAEMPRLDSLWLHSHWPVQDDGDIAIHRWPAVCLLRDLTIIRCVDCSAHKTLDGSIDLGIPAALQLKVLQVAAKVVGLWFEDLEATAARLEMLRLVSVTMHGFSRKAMDSALRTRGNRLSPWPCRTDPASLLPPGFSLGPIPAGYTCVSIEDCLVHVA